MSAKQWVIWGALCAVGFAEAQDVGGPRLTVGQTEFELPELIQGQTTKVEVQLSNTGDAPLVISLVDVTCGCTVVDYPRDPVPAGESRLITLNFDSTDKQGNVKVDVFLYSNDPTQQDRGAFCTRLVIRGEVGSHFRLRPRSAAFGEVLAGGTQPHQRTIHVNGRGPARTGLKLALKGQLPDYLDVQIEPGEEGKAQIQITLLPTAPPGDVLHYLEFSTGIDVQPLLRLPVVVAVTGMIRAPSGVDLRRLQRGVESPLERIPVRLSDAVEGVPSSSLPIHRLEYDRTRLTVEVEHISPRRADLLVRGLTSGPVGPFSAPIRVFLDLQQQPLLVIPVFGNVVGRVRCSPSALAQGARSVTVTGARVTAAALEPALPGVSVKCSPAETGTLVELVGGELSRDTQLILTTDAPDEERVVVEVLSAP